MGIDENSRTLFSSGILFSNYTCYNSLISQLVFLELLTDIMCA